MQHHAGGQVGPQLQNAFQTLTQETSARATQQAIGPLVQKAQMQIWCQGHGNANPSAMCWPGMAVQQQAVQSTVEVEEVIDETKETEEVQSQRGNLHALEATESLHKEGIEQKKGEAAAQLNIDEAFKKASQVFAEREA